MLFDFKFSDVNVSSPLMLGSVSITKAKSMLPRIISRTTFFHIPYSNNIIVNLCEKKIVSKLTGDLSLF